jgi:hypothetical protein
MLGMEAVAVDRPGEDPPREVSPSAAAGARKATWQPGRHGVPLLLFGGLAALSLPLATRTAPQMPTGISVISLRYPTVTEAMYFGGGSATGPPLVPLGWYWVAALVAGLLLTAAWYRWLDRRARSRTPLGGYLATGLALAVVTAALPLLAWGQPVQLEDLDMQAWTWLETFWELGTFALLCVAVGLGMLAWIGRSRTLAVVTAAYTASVCLAGWKELRQPALVPAFAPSGDRAVLLPAAVLLLAGLGAMLAASLRIVRSREAA